MFEQRQSYTLPKLKPLFANLKRLKIGKYLHSEEFKLFTIELNIDEAWNEYRLIVYRKKSVINPGFHDTEEDEDAFLQLIVDYYDQNQNTFDFFIITVLINFANWNSYKLDFTAVIRNLKSFENINELLLESFIKKTDEIKSLKPEKEEISIPSSTKNNSNIKHDLKKIFIVHGHDDLAKNETARFLEKVGLEPIILHEQASSGQTIIEKIENFSNVGFGIVLYTPCDVGEKKGNEKNLRDRARQNVVFEHGFLIGKIGRKNVTALVKGQIETPNDISGIVYISMDDNWKSELAKELKNSGYDIDMNKSL